MPHSFLGAGGIGDASNNNSLIEVPTYTASDFVLWLLTYGSGTKIGSTLTDTAANPYTRIAIPSDDFFDVGNGQGFSLYYNTGVIAGSPTVTYGLASSVQFRGMGFLRYSGLGTVAPTVLFANPSNPGAGINAISSGPLTPAVQPGVLIGFCMDDTGTAGESIAANTAWNDRGNFASWDSNIPTKTRIQDIRVTSLAAAAATFKAAIGTGVFAAFAIFIPEPGATSAPVGGSRIRKNTIHPGRHPDRFGKRLKTRRNTFILASSSIAGSIAATEDNDVSVLVIVEKIPATLSATEANDTASFTAISIPLNGSRRLKSSFHPGRGPYNIYRFVRTKRNTAIFAANPSGSISANEDNDTATLAALETIPATLSATENADTSAFSVVETIPATLVASEASDTSSFIAVESINGILSATEADDTATFIGAETISGSLSAIEASDLASLIALEVISGTITATEAADIASFSDGNTNAGSIAAVESSDTSVFVVLETLPGQIATTESNDSAGFVAVELIAGSINTIEASDSANFTTVETIVGSLSIIESSDVSTITALETISGSINASESADTASFSDGNTISGSIVATEANDVSGLSVSENLIGSISAFESNDIASFASQQNINAILSAIENADTSSFVLNESVTGSINVLEASDTAILNAVESLIGSIGAVEANDTCAFISNIIPGSITALETNDLANFVALESFIGSISAIEDFDISSFSDYMEESTTFPIGNKFDRSIKATLKLITKNGQKVVWRIISDIPNSSQPWQAASQSLTNKVVSIVFLPVNRRGFESLTLKKDMEIPKGCVLGYMGAVDFEPNLEDVIIRNGIELSVFYIDKLNPNGQNILYTLLLKE